MSVLEYTIDPCIEYWIVIILNAFISIINFCTRYSFGWTITYGKEYERQKSFNDFSKGAQMVKVIKFGAYATLGPVRNDKN